MASNYSVGGLEIRFTSDMSQLLAGFERLRKSAQGTHGQLKGISDEFKKTGGFKNGLEQVNGSVKKLNTSFLGLSGGVKSIALATIGVFTLRRAIVGLMNTIEKSIVGVNELIENYNLFNVSFGGKTKDAIRFQNELNYSLRNVYSEGLRYQGFFQNLTTSLGIVGDESVIVSENLTKLTYDLASLFNTKYADMYSKLQSGIVGQTKPLRAVGIDVTQQTLQPILYELGINKLVTELTQAEKVLLRYLSIIKQSTNAQGDMARTIEAPANQLKILNAQLRETSQWFGAIFINSLAGILPYINAVVFVIRDLTKWLALLVGFSMETWDFLPPSMDGGVEIIDEDNIEQSLEGIKKIKKQLRGFDEINLITSQTSASPLGGSGEVYDQLVNAIKGYDNGMANIKMRATEIAEKIMSWVGFAQDFNEETGEMNWKFVGLDSFGEIGRVIEEFGLLLGFVRERYMVPFVEFMRTNIAPIFAMVFEEVGKRTEALWGKLADFFAWLRTDEGSGALDVFVTGLAVLIGVFSTVNLASLGLAVGLGAVMLVLKPILSIFTLLTSPIGLVALAIAGIVLAMEYFDISLQDVLTFLTPFYEKILGIKDVMADWLTKAVDYYNSDFVPMIENLVKWFKEEIMPMVERFGKTFLLVWEKFIKPFWDNLKETAKRVWDTISVIWESVKPTVMSILGFIMPMLEFIGHLIIIVTGRVVQHIGNILAILSYLFQFLGGIVKWVFEKIINPIFGNFFDAVKNTFKMINALLTGDFVNAWKYFKDAVVSILKVIGNIFIIIMNGVIKGINNMITGFLRPINTLIDGWNTVFGGLLGRIPNIKISIPVIPYLADGGLVDAGQLFIAREKGPEIVGSYGNKTAVMNNKQIVDAVSMGVAKAVSQVMGGKENSSQPLHLTVQIGSSQVADAFVDMINDSVSRGKILKV